MMPQDISLPYEQGLRGNWRSDREDELTSEHEGLLLVEG